MKSIGADHAIDNTKEDLARSEKRYDLILDNTGRNRFSDMKRILTDDGLILPNSGHGGMSYVLKAFALEPFDRHIGKMKIADLKKGDLKEISRLAEEGRLRPHIDRTFGSDEVPAAIDYLDRGEVKGKIVITF